MLSWLNGTYAERMSLRGSVVAATTSEPRRFDGTAKQIHPDEVAIA